MICLPSSTLNTRSKEECPRGKTKISLKKEKTSDVFQSWPSSRRENKKGTLGKPGYLTFHSPLGPGSPVPFFLGFLYP
jgi:hypothetical protein